MTLDPPVIEYRIPAFQRCDCPECKRLDREFPNEGWQVALFRYVPSLRPVRRIGKMSIEGMWQFQSGSLAEPDKLAWGGVVVLETGRVLGGDSFVTYIGKYVIDRDHIIADVHVQRWNHAIDGETVFGRIPLDGHAVILHGTRTGDVIEGYVYPALQSDMKLPARMEKIAELP